MHMSDKEQVQLIKNWWKQYGTSILVALCAFFVVNYGWRYWQGYKYQQMQQSSICYTQLLTAIEQKNADDVKLFAERLIKDYSSSSYASFAAFLLAKKAVEDGDLKLAQEKLQFVTKKSPNKTLQQIALMRLARIFIADKNSKKALDLLSSIKDHAYTAEVAEIRGDAYMADGNTEMAKKSYKEAKIALVGDAKSPLLQLKMRQF